MANSDNVLRAGLTPKHIDVAELIRNTSFDPMNPQEIKLAPVHKDGKQSYPVPVDDFAFDILTVTDEIREQYIRSAEILFCIDGQVNVTCEEHTIVLSAGSRHLSAMMHYVSVMPAREHLLGHTTNRFVFCG